MEVGELDNVKVEIFIPSGDLERMVNCLTDLGLLRVGDYDSCYTYTRVKAHFRPKEDAEPYIGEVGEETLTEEIKLEFNIGLAEKEKAERVIRENHPYEKAMINFIPLL